LPFYEKLGIRGYQEKEIVMDIVELYYSEQEFSVEREREIAEEYERYVDSVEEQADRADYARMVEM
jgi:predicted nucleic-acid-binding protein